MSADVPRQTIIGLYALEMPSVAWDDVVDQ